MRVLPGVADAPAPRQSHRPSHAHHGCCPASVNNPQWFKPRRSARLEKVLLPAMHERRGSRRRAGDQDPREQMSTAMTVSQARLRDLQGRNDTAAVGARRRNLLLARQRAVTQKEIRMAEKRERRAEEMSCRAGSRRAREDPVTEVVNPGGGGKRRRFVSPPGDLERMFEVEKEEQIGMEVDVVGSMQAMQASQAMQVAEGGKGGGGGEGGEPFSPPACSPSRRPWQLRPTPETRPDAEGNLTRSWLPPVSPYGLIEEDLLVCGDPFKLLVVCQLLNKTGATMVRHVVYRERFFDRYPSPASLMDADLEALGALLRPLGLWRRRAAGLKRFAREFHELFWDVYTDSYKVNAKTRVGDLYGCGEYAVDAVRCWLGGGCGLSPGPARSHPLLLLDHRVV